MSAPIPFPSVKSRTPSPLRPDLVGAVQRENADVIQALFPEAMRVLAERMATVQCITSAKLIVEACLPARGRLIPGIDTSPAGIERALADGRITATEARDMAQAVAACRSIEQIEALAARIEALEAALRAAA